MRRLAAVALLVAVSSGSGTSHAQEIMAGLSHHAIGITADFDGTEILVFGAIESKGDIVVVVRGPRQEVVVRKKAPLFGIWVNAHSAVFRSVPGFYGIASTRPLGEIVDADMRRVMEIGIGSLRLEPADMTPSVRDEFSAALIELKQARGLYPVEPGTVSLSGGRLFRATIALPADVPVGTYAADAFLIRDGEVVAAQSSPLIISKAGFGAAIYSFAHRESAFYGIVAVIAAVLAGLAANVLLRRT